MQDNFSISNYIKILIIIEDQTNISFEEILKLLKLPKGIVLTNLSKLIKENLIKFENNLYKLTTLGESWLDDKLTILKKLDYDDRKFKLVFIKNYSNRSCKTLFVDKLKKNGFVSFAYQVIIGKCDYDANIHALAKYYKINEIEIIEIGNFQEKYLDYWDIAKIDDKYEQFVINAKTVLSNNRLLTAIRINAKINIYYFANILISDPRIGTRGINYNETIKKALGYYQKIKIFCYD
ncbi:MAG: hypothetical protein CEN91_24 [Candidatus Berkelbacteria bacterium Licking1014_85]|uniref:Uncharacterized protein n=1 Tax=Candidatus Berkelbacteria bacterium Licking1014_85 TaxID=2017148 RepID=A0A554LML1_9BACT|nr:MAG: hypothetical protein CEN91_24 [Candidatus Berkelbacteria bacterium Licking1014_85]